MPSSARAPDWSARVGTGGVHEWPLGAVSLALFTLAFSLAASSNFFRRTQDSDFEAVTWRGQSWGGGVLGFGPTFVVVFPAVWPELMRNVNVWQGEFCNRETDDSIAGERQRRGGRQSSRTRGGSICRAGEEA